MSEKKSINFPWTFLLITFGFTWLILLPGVLASLGYFTLPLPMYALVAVAQFGPSLTAFFLTYRRDGKAGVLQLFKRALNFRIHWKWLAVIFLLPLILAGAAMAIHILTGGSITQSPLWSQPVAILPYFVFIFFFMGPVPEEFGWRGYLLDRLQSRWSALIASLLLGFIWWLWHLPGNLMQGVAQSTIPQGAYLLWILAFSVLITWIYNSTGGNLLAVMLFHTMANLAIALFPLVEADYYYLAILTVIAAAVVVAFSGRQHLMRQDRAQVMKIHRP